MHFLSKNSSTNLAALFSTSPESMKKLRVHKRKDSPSLKNLLQHFFFDGGNREGGVAILLKLHLYTDALRVCLGN